MPLTELQQEWLSHIAGLKVAKETYDQQTSLREVMLHDIEIKLEPLKERLRKQMTQIFKTGPFSKLLTLDEKGGQLDEFDLYDLPDVKNISAEQLQQMREAMDAVRELTLPIRNTKIEIINEKGQKEKIPLMTDEELADEVFMPLVRERLVPEWVLTDRFSKTEQMIRATDKLYKERLAEYTAQLDEEEKSLLESGKTAITDLGGLAQKAAAMIPGGDGEMAQSVIGLVTLGSTTLITGVQALSARQITDSVNSLIDSIGQIMSQSLALATGNKELAEFAANTYTAGATLAKVGVHLTKKPDPSVDGAIDELANGLGAAFDAGFSKFSGGDKVDKVLVTALKNSAVQFFKSAASGLRIKEHLENGDADALIKELSQVAQGTLERVNGIVTEARKQGQSEEAAKAIEEKQKALEEEIKKGIQLGELGIATGKKIVDAVKTKQLKMVAGAIVDGIGDVLTGSLSFASEEAASTVGNVFRSTSSAALVAYYLTYDPPETSLALHHLGVSLEGAIGMANPKNKDVQLVASSVGTLFSTARLTFDLKKAIDEDRYKDIVETFSKLGEGIFAQTMKLGEGTGTISKEQSEQSSEIFEFAQGQVKDLAGAWAGFKEGLNDEEAQAELERRLDELRSAEALKEIESAKDEVERLLVQGEGGEQAADTRSIAILIKEMQRDRMIMEMAIKVVSGGTAVVEKFVAPMAIGNAAVKLAANLIKAAQRAMTLNTWIANQKDMAKAVSSFESSAANFVKNQGEQFSHYAIQAALELARLIGEIVGCTGIASAAGQGLSKAAALALAAEEIAYKYYKEADLARAWKATRKAWDHPESRKLALVARSLNPTLAKYTLAWGATVKRDPLCQAAMDSCGLNPLTLSHKDSNVKEVQRYLEVCFNEDNIVLKRYAPPDWMPANVEITAKSWCVAKTRGETLGGVQVATTGKLEEAFAVAEEFRPRYEKLIGPLRADSSLPTDEFEKTHEEYLLVLERLADELLRYHPETEAGRIHPEMQGLVVEFRRLVDEAIGEAEGTYTELVDMGITRMQESAS